MALRTLSLALAASALAGALWLYTRDLWVYGPIMIYPFVGATLVGGMMVLRPILVRKLGGGGDPTARALEVIALGAMLAPGAGYMMAFSFLHLEGDHCGLTDTLAVATVLGQSWPIWAAGEVVVLVALGRRKGHFAGLRGHEVFATTLTLIAAPPLGVLACVATGFESNHGGAGVIFLLPVAVAAGATVVEWTVGRSFATATAARRLATAVLILDVPLSLGLRSRSPLLQTCVSFSTTTTWSLLAEVGWTAGPLLAGMLCCARNPRPLALPAHDPDPQLGKSSRPFPSLALAASAFLLFASLVLVGPLLYSPVIGGVVIAGMVALRFALERQAGGGADPTARALEVLAAGAMLAVYAGVLIMVCCLHHVEGEDCGLPDTARLVTVLRQAWPFWSVGEVVVLVALARRRATIARLSGYHAGATILALIAAPPLAVLACVATMYEANHGGAAVTFLLPTAIASGSTVVAWTVGRSFAIGTVLRRFAAAVLIVAVPVSLMLRSRAPLPHGCVSFSTTTTWSLLAEVGWAAGPCLAVMLYSARDPLSPTD